MGLLGSPMGDILLFIDKTLSRLLTCKVDMRLSMGGSKQETSAKQINAQTGPKFGLNGKHLIKSSPVRRDLCTMIYSSLDGCGDSARRRGR